MPKPDPKKKPERNWIKYSSIAMQLIITILIFTFLGQYLDERFDTSPWLLLVFSLMGVFGGLYVSLRDFL